VEHLFFAWQQVAAQLGAARHILLLSDYDGTLTPIVERPELANLSQRTKEILQVLAHQHRFTVGIISGRALKDLQQRAGIKGIVYAGNHGLEIEGPGVSFVNPVAEEIKPVFRFLYQVLSNALATVRGALVEDKGLTLSVHYRMVDEDRSHEVRNIFEGIIAMARSLRKVRVTSGKKVYEVRPAVDWDKGKAIALLLDRYGNPKAGEKPLGIFLGDDLTDEDGFKMMDRHSGISIFVGEERSDSAAHYYLKSPTEVEQFLSMLVNMQRGRL
jgi:trehalose 6-phosphate phosphatase